MSKSARETYRGPAIFSYGFRPFFLLSLIFAVLIIPLWMTVYLGKINLQSSFISVDWHIHEMLFGYTAAVICGFLFTAIPNWTGRMPVRGKPLILLVFLWISGRAVMLGVGAFSPYLVMAIDCSFLAAVGAMVVIEIVAGRNWRNLKIIIPILLFLGANILFHTEVIMHGNADYGLRMGFAVVLFLITLIGGRIIPSFTRNWLVKSNLGPLPIPFGRFDIVCLIVGAISLIAWIIGPLHNASNILLIISAALHFARLSRWSGIRTMRSPLLFMLHVAYGFIPLGFFIVGLGLQTSGLHVLGIGAIGGMTVAVMIRATLGHTGRPLHIKASLVAAFVILISAGIIRSITSLELTGLMITAGLWVLSMGMVLLHIGPWLWAPKTNQRTPNKQS